MVHLILFLIILQLHKSRMNKLLRNTHARNRTFHDFVLVPLLRSNNLPRTREHFDIVLPPDSASSISSSDSSVQS